MQLLKIHNTWRTSNNQNGSGELKMAILGELTLFQKLNLELIILLCSSF